MFHCKTLARAFFVIYVFVSPHVWASSVFQLNVEKNSGKSVTGLATKVNESHFITDSLLLDNAKTIFIIDHSVSPVAKVVANVVVRDDVNRLTILQASNINGNPVTFAQKEQELGTKIKLKTLNNEFNSLVQRFQVIDGLGKSKLYVHNALYKEGEWTAPLYNNCDEIIGLSIFEESFLGGFKAPEFESYAQTMSMVTSMLRRNSIKFNQATTMCLSVEQQAHAAAEKALADKLAAEKEAQRVKAEADQALEKQQKDFEDKAKVSQLEQEKAAQAASAQVEAEKAKVKEEQARAEAALKEAEEQKDKLAKQKNEAERQAKQIQDAEQVSSTILIAGGTLLLVLLIIFLVISRKRKKAALVHAVEFEKRIEEISELATSNEELNEELNSMKSTFSDILLEGQTHEGNHIRIKVNGNGLAVAKEQVLGREASQVDYLLAEGEISRKHVKLVLKGDQLYAEDLGSQNGTWVDNQQLEPGALTVLHDGAKLKLSSIEFSVSYL